MVICVVVGCSKRSDRDKDVSFHRIPAVNCLHGKEDFELRKKRRDDYLATISREDIDTSVLHKYRICSRHFVSGKVADLYDTTSPMWLPTLNLGHEKRGSGTTASSNAVERWERAQEREKWQKIDELLPTLVTNEIDSVIREEVECIATEQIDTAMQYFIPRPVSCECTSKVESLE